MKHAFVALALLIAAPAPALAQTTPQTGDNAEMTALFTADQAVRESAKPEQYADRAFVTKMIADDAARRAATRRLLDAGQLTTADDYYHAAFLFQHGSTPPDYLLAHTLAIAATAKGHKEAAWIAAATLDRYLQSSGQKQIYGTQYRSAKDTGPTMEPYDRTLVPDALRTALGVPDQAAQEVRLTRMKTTGTFGK